MKKIVFFDGVCQLCNRFVSALIRFDSHNSLYFAPIQGKTAKAMNLEFDELGEMEQSIVYVDSKGNKYFRSTAVLKILEELFRWGKILICLEAIPLFIRDGVYKLIAKNRYRLFGKRGSCRIPNEKEKGQFLD